MIATLLIDTGTGPRRVRLQDFLDPAAEERAQEDSHRWIKGLRAARVDGQPFRRRFTLRGDSLWWFAELYLHKEQAILTIFRTIAAFDALAERERPLTVRVVAADWRTRAVIAARADARRIRFAGARDGRLAAALRRMRVRFRATGLYAAAVVSRARQRAQPAPPRTRIAAFVHTAFWRSDAGDGSAESYIGPVLHELEQQAPGAVGYVGVGPVRNFRARRWWDALRISPSRAVIPIEQLAPGPLLTGARRLWRDRRRNLRSLLASDDLRRLAVIRDCDCWRIVREELAGIALLQFPWSARAMDEAGAALDALAPQAALTYAEAGGWGRAIALECRRRDIPLAGLQHGFIYRHWLNYLHEPDEMTADPDNPDDAGFPLPALTVLFDDYAARHLVTAGRFPRPALAVTGSARLDELAARSRRLTAADLDRARADAGASPSQQLVVVATKFKEAAGVLPDLIAAVRELPDVQLAIKAHPAETAEIYQPLVEGVPNARVLPASAPLAPLVSAAAAIVTVNSTVAIDALVLGVPALVLGLPNNLSPFVDAGTMVGARSTAEIVASLRRILYDREFRGQLTRTTEAFAAQHRIATDGGAAARSAAAVLALAGHAIGTVKPDCPV
jgi:Capsule polysaccharide biosynthesis protein